MRPGKHIAYLREHALEFAGIPCLPGAPDLARRPACLPSASRSEGMLGGDTRDRSKRKKTDVRLNASLIQAKARDAIMQRSGGEG